MKTLVSTLLALTSAALLTSSANAQTVFTPGDLFIGFRANTGTGASNSFLIDIGQASQFLGLAPGTSFQLSLSGASTTGADLTATFGSDWYTRLNGSFTSIQIGLGGYIFTANSNDAANTIYTSNSSATPYARFSGSAQTAIGTTISALGQNFDGSDLAANTANATVQLNGSPNTWRTFMTGGANGSGGGFNAFPQNEIGTTGQMYLNRLIPGSGVNAIDSIGYFTFASNGTITFTAVPEPSTYALLGAAALVGVIMLHRRRAVRA